MNKKVCIHHRALNSRTRMETLVLPHYLRSRFHHGAEGDVCWGLLNGAPVAYMHHPDGANRPLNARAIRRRAASGELLLLQDALAIHPCGHHVIELKTGFGDIDRAFTEIGRSITQAGASNVLIDCYRLDHLARFKKLFPHIRTSLHTNLVLGSRVLEATGFGPRLSLRRMQRLPFVDHITLTLTTQPAHWLSKDLDRALAHAHRAGKQFGLGGITRLSTLQQAFATSATHIYLRSQQAVDYALSA